MCISACESILLLAVISSMLISDCFGSPAPNSRFALVLHNLCNPKVHEIFQCLNSIEYHIEIFFYLIFVCGVYLCLLKYYVLMSNQIIICLVELPQF